MLTTQQATMGPHMIRLNCPQQSRKYPEVGRFIFVEKCFGYIGVYSVGVSL